MQLARLFALDTFLGSGNSMTCQRATSLRNLFDFLHQCAAWVAFGSLGCKASLSALSCSIKSSVAPVFYEAVAACGRRGVCDQAAAETVLVALDSERPAQGHLTCPTDVRWYIASVELRSWS